MTEQICPICEAETADMRHVGVECFYAVDEVAPRTEKKTIFMEVDPDASYLGTTRRYAEGTRDKFTVVSTGRHNSRIDNNPEPVTGIRLLEQAIYSMPCCKSCRSDFLSMFGQWTEGKMVTRSEPTETASIPIRENGAVRYITEAEWREREASLIVVGAQS